MGEGFHAKARKEGRTKVRFSSGQKREGRAEVLGRGGGVK